MNVPTSYIHSNGAALTLTLYADETASRSVWYTMAAMTSLATRWRPAAHSLVTLASLDRVDTRRLLVQRLQLARGDGGSGSGNGRRNASRLSIDVSQLLRPRWAPLYLREPRSSRNSNSSSADKEKSDSTTPLAEHKHGGRVYPEVESSFECDGRKFTYLWPNSMLVLMERSYWQKEARDLLTSANTLLGSKVMDEFIASLPRHLKEPDGDVVCLHPTPRNTLFELHTDDLRRQAEAEGFTRTFANREVEQDSSIDDMFNAAERRGSTKNGANGGRRTAPLQNGDLRQQYRDRPREDSYSSTVFSMTVSNHESDQLTLFDFDIDSGGYAEEVHPGSRRGSCYSPTSVDSMSPRARRANGGMRYSYQNEESGLVIDRVPSMQSLANTNAAPRDSAASAATLGLGAYTGSSVRRVSAQFERTGQHLSADSPVTLSRKQNGSEKHQPLVPRLSLTTSNTPVNSRNRVTEALLANRSAYAPLSLNHSKKSEPALNGLKSPKGAARPQCLEIPMPDVNGLASPKPTHGASAVKKRSSFRKATLSPLLSAFSKGKSKKQQPSPSG